MCLPIWSCHPVILQGRLKCNPLRLVVNLFSLCSFVILCWFGPVILDPQGSAETQVIRNGQPLIYDILRNLNDHMVNKGFWFVGRQLPSTTHSKCVRTPGHSADFSADLLENEGTRRDKSQGLRLFNNMPVLWAVDACYDASSFVLFLQMCM